MNKYSDEEKMMVQRILGSLINITDSDTRKTVDKAELKAWADRLERRYILEETYHD